jgi:hypothetical protein
MTLLRATAVGLALATLAAVPEPLEGQQQVLSSPVRLSEFRGMTVVLSFFYRARTPG